MNQLHLKSQSMVFDARRLWAFAKMEMEDASISINTTVGLFFLFLILIVLANIILVNRSILKPLQELSMGLWKLGSGNNNFRIKILKNDEMGSLGKSFNKMANDLEIISWQCKLKIKKEAATKILESKHQRDEVSQRLTSIVRAAVVGFISIDKNGIISEWNKAAELILGYSKKEVLGKKINKMLPHNRVAEAEDSMEKAWSGLTVRIETVRISKDGCNVPVELTLSPIVDKSGKTYGLSGFLVDLSDRINMKFHLDEQISYLNSTALVSYTDIYGMIIYVNDNFCKMSKYSRDELVDSTHGIVNSGYHQATFWKDMWAQIKHGKVWQGLIKSKTKTGADYWVNSTILRGIVLPEN